MPKPLALRESTTISEAAAAEMTKTGRMVVQHISPGWGSSGYYSPEVLEQAAADNVIPAGTQMYADHPTAAENEERPVRSIKDLMAYTVEDARIATADDIAVWGADPGALVSEAHVLASYRTLVEEAKTAIGTSIRGSATDIVQGVADGRSGPIIEGLHDVKSVDFVTRAGRGGKVLAVLESADVEEARNIGQWVESRIHRDFTITADDMAGDGRLTREERIGLSSAIGDALAAFVANLEANQPQLYTRDLWDDPQDTIAAAIEAAATDVPVTRPDSTNPTTEADQEVTMGNIQIEESVHTGLVEKAGRVDVLESENATQKARIAQLEEAEAIRARLTRAATIIAERAKEADVEFTALESRGLLAELPLKDGDLDEAAFTTAVDESAADKKTAAGSGTVRGFGSSTLVDESDDEDFDLDKHLAESLGDLMPTTARTVKEA